jgi:Glyoxalase-like domain
MEDKTTNVITGTTDILHHVGLINADLETSTAVYEKLGFALTPLSLPRIVLKSGGAPETLGAGNRHAIFRNNYLELLGVVDPKRWAEVSRGAI